MQYGAPGFFYPGSLKKSVLLIHGLTGSPMEMRYLGKHLHKYGFTVYAPVLAGHCQNVNELLATSWEDWYASIDTAYHDLREQNQTHEIYTVGICAGGALGLILAANYPELAGVATYSLAFRYDGWNMSQLYRLTTALSLVAGLPLIRRIQFAEKYPFGLKDEKLRALVKNGKILIEGTLDYFPMGTLYQMYRMNEHLKRVLPRIYTPTLLLHAIEDDMSHWRNSEYVIKRIGGRCQMRLLEDSYHMIHIDKERRKVAELTTEFFIRKGNTL
ncbi:carboxylesterase [Gammaproteobacteria bacterium]